MSKMEKCMTLKDIRNQLFIKSILIIGPILFLLTILINYLNVVDGNWFMLVINSTSFLALLFIYLNKKIAIDLRKCLFLTIFYVASVILTIGMESIGPGLLCLMAMSIWFTVIVSTRAGLYSALLNMIICIVVELLIISNVFSRGIFVLPDYENVFVIIVFILLNFILVLSVNNLILKLEERINIANELTKQIEKDNLKLQLAKEKAEESDRLKSAFLANIGHEIRTPMNAIVGFSDLLRRDDLSKEKRNKFINYVTNNSDLLLRIINDIIELSKIDSGSIKVKKEKINLREMWEEVNVGSNLLCKDDTEIKTEFSIPEKKIELVTDRSKLIQIILNLYSNACKYAAGGHVLIGFSYIEKKDVYAFSVKDDGKGIEPDKLDKIFERFYQINSEKTGVGLGLSIVKALVGVLNGKIEVESTPGSGTIFTVFIPST